MGERVWTCHEGCRHEGGSTTAVAATFEDALAWLRAKHAEAVEDAVWMNEREKDDDVKIGWRVEDIAIQADKERAHFYYEANICAVRPFAVERFARPTSPGAEP